MKPANEPNGPEHEFTEAEPPRKLYGPAKIRILETQSTQGGGNPAYIEDGFGIYES